jgi:hypothetical protein
MMELEINKLITSEFKMLKELGWLLYNREDQNGGLILNEVHKLLKAVTAEELEKEIKDSYDEGFNCGYWSDR